MALRETLRLVERSRALAFPVGDGASASAGEEAISALAGCSGCGEFAEGERPHGGAGSDRPFTLVPTRRA